MTLNDKVKVGETTAGTSTSTTTASQRQTYNHYKAEQGWECPRCGRINAPWVRQCDCFRSNWTITTLDQTITPDWTYKPYGWWEKVECSDTSPQIQLDSDTFRIHPDSTIYSRGNDYKVEDTYVNVGGTQCNKTDSNITAWNCTNPDNCHTPHYTTETVVNDGIHNFYNLKTSKETK